MDGTSLRKHIDYATAVVSQWPKWQQNILRDSGEPMNAAPRPFVDNTEESVMPQDTPAWHHRPTCPGMWVCVGGKGYMRGRDVVLVLTQEDLDRGAPFHVERVYGPIPEDKE